VLKAVKILFLGLSILFSFGFTAVESNCKTINEISCESHSCCKKEKEKPQQKKDCDGSCCLQPISVLRLNDFASINESIQQETKKYNPDYLLYLQIDGVNYNVESRQNVTILTRHFSSKIRHKQQALNQVWLI